MFTDTYQLIKMRIDEAHREAALERTMRRARQATTADPAIQPAMAATEAGATMAVAARPADEDLVAAGERSDALLVASCCSTSADRAA